MNVKIPESTNKFHLYNFYHCCPTKFRIIIFYQVNPAENANFRRSICENLRFLRDNLLVLKNKIKEY